MCEFSSDLVVKLLDDDPDGLWQLVEPLVYKSDVANMTIVAPVGFKTDFCSVPRIPGAYDLLGDRARKSGTIHDYLYSAHITTREMADEVLREMVQIDGLNHAEAEAFYLAVRLGGASHW